MNPKELKTRLDTLAVFRSFLQDPVFVALKKTLEAPSPDRYAAFVSLLYEANGGDLGDYIRQMCENSENCYVRRVGAGETVPKHLQESLSEELSTLQAVADLTPEQLQRSLSEAAFLPSFRSGGVDVEKEYLHRTENIGKYGYGIYAKHRMFYLSETGQIIPVRSPDPVTLDSLVDYETQRKAVLDNTKALLAGRPAANLLLTGDAGTGKSSTIKAVVNALYGEGLRIIEVRKDQLRSIPRLLDELAKNPLKFILFIDDLSFLKDDDNFNALKAVLEGSVSAKTANVVIYATGNRRHLIKESFSDREGDEIHRNDTIQELISLSERFGLQITFSKPDKKTYLHIVQHLAAEAGLETDPVSLAQSAERFALERGGRSARVARQFIDGLLAKEN